jgi:hypothetical protein
MTCGVPQGSVLGLTLWNIGYNSVLNTQIGKDSDIICYADDTMLIAAGKNLEEAVHNANLDACKIVKAIESLGLDVAAHKTQAMYFYERTSIRNRNRILVIKNSAVKLGNSIKYLGLIIDSKWSFIPHFEAIAVKIDKTLGHLTGLMQNTSGPDEKKRKLYANIVYSIINYGSPVWVEDKMLENSRIKVILRKITRRIAQRTCRVYRTVSGVAALLIASLIPPEIVARRQMVVYNKIRKEKEQGRTIDPKTLEGLVRNTKKEALEEWKSVVAKMQDGDSGARARRAIIPVLNNWYKRKHGRITFHMTQIIIGHGCFGSFLYKIKKVNSPICEHCKAEEDTAEHTLEGCVSWINERNELKNCIGGELDLGSIIKVIVMGADKWNGFSKYCSVVMSKKKDLERIRQKEAASGGHLDPPIRGRSGYISDVDSD